MPTVLVVNGFRFFFYSNENNEPAHIHVVKGNGNGKIWLAPSMAVAYFLGFTAAEVKEIISIVEKHAVAFKSKWHEYFGK